MGFSISKPDYMTKYYNAIVKTDYGAAITYHQISTVKNFIQYIDKNVSWQMMYFYLLPYRDAKKGTYAGFYSRNKGLQLFK
jgi:hypothetical protein